MANLIGVKLSRFDATPWGFRLQGGKDFGGPLIIQKVNGGSPAEKAGLQAGDAVIKVNDVEVFNLRHKEAQDYIVRAGNNFEITVERGGSSTWKPQVTPVGPAPVNYSPVTNVKPVTKTSLAAKRQDVPPVSGHNFAPKPYSGPQVNGISDATVKSIVNKQYNTPVGIYSEETIAETLSAQAEVLAGGVLGVNFKKNEKIYNAANSEVLKMVQEIDSEPKEPEPEPSVGGSITSPSATGLRHVVAPETKPTPTTPHDDPFKVLPPGQNICADCERLIVGVFVRIKDKNLHVECFKCATCGTSLKNVGYYNINNKLYCDIHAKLVARQNPPAPNLEPVTVPPGGQVPAGTISAALARAPVGPASNLTAPSRAPVSTYAPAPAPLSPGNLSPQPGTLGPLPFHPISQHTMPENNFVTENNMKNIITALPALAIADTDSGDSLPESIGTTPSKAPRGGTTHVSAPRPVQAPSSLAGPKPFSTPTAPLTSPARPTPAGSIFVWPPSTSEKATCPTATPLYVPPNPCQQAGSSVMPTGKAAPRIPLASVKSAPATEYTSAPILTPSAQDHEATCPSPLTSALTIAPECPCPSFSGSVVAPDTISMPFQVTQTASTQQTAPFPQPFSVYLAKHHTPLGGVPNPTPIQEGHSQPLDELPPVKTVLQYLSHETNAMSVEDSQAEDLQALKDAELQKKFSLCSQEVFAINVDKPAPKFEALSETLEAQLMESSLTPGSVKRPGSPVPMQKSKMSSLQEPDITTVQETSRQAVSEQDAHIKTLVTEISTPEASNTVTESVPSPVDRKLSVPLEIQSTSHAESTQPTGNTDIEMRQVSNAPESQDFTVAEQSDLSEQSSAQVSEVKSCNQITIETQMLQSQFVSELEASDGSYVPSPVSAVCSQSEGILKSGENMFSQTQTISSESVSGFVPVSREQEYSASQFQQQTRHLSTQQSSSLISEHAQSLKIFTNAQPTSQLFPSQAQDPTIAIPSPLLSAVTTAPDCTSSSLPPVAEPEAPILTQPAPTSNQAAHSAAVKPVASLPLSISVNTPHSQEVACPSPLLSALTVASDRPYSPLPSATKPMAHFPIQSSSVSTQAIKPVVPASLPAGIQAPLARGAAYPSVIKPAPLPASSKVPQLYSSAPVPVPANTEAPLNPEDACPSPLTLALTIASDRPYSPLFSSTRSPGFMPVQTTATPATDTAAAAINFIQSGVKAPFTELPLRDETQLPLLSAPSQKISVVSKPQHVSTRNVPIQRPVSTGPLPVIGAFRPIIPQTEFKPVPSSLVSDKEPNLSFPPVSEEFKTESLVSAPARPKTPVQRVATPTARSRSGTPFQQRKCTTTGLQKPAIIPLYQQQMGDSPGQRPRSATPTCPMTVPRTQTPQPQSTKTELPYTPQKPSAFFQRQPPPQKPYESYQPVDRDAPPAVVQSQLSVQQQPLIPFPNIPLPEDFKVEPQALPFRPCTFSAAQPCFTPQQEALGLSPLSAPQPAPLDPVFQFPPFAAPQPTTPALVANPSLLAGPHSVHVAPEPSVTTTMPIIPVSATQPISVAKTPSAPSSSSVPNAGGSGVGVPGGSHKGASFAGSTAPRRGRGVLIQQTSIVAGRVAVCGHCKSQIRGPFITALGKNWCPDHFKCVNGQCHRPLADIGFVEEKGELYCEYCFEKYLAPTCDKCNTKIKGDCLNAIGKHFHPECFLCAYCGKMFGNNPFFLEDGMPYCEDDWNELFTTKCFACGFPIEAGDRWVEALSNNYHSQCFNCTNCKKNLEGQSFYAKGGRPFCKAHAR